MTAGESTPTKTREIPAAPVAVPAAVPRPVERTAFRVRLEGLNAWYGDQHSVRDVSLTFRANEATALIGPRVRPQDRPERRAAVDRDGVPEAQPVRVDVDLRQRRRRRALEEPHGARRRTAFLMNGELVEAGPTQQLFTAPADPRTEDYVSGRFG